MSSILFLIKALVAVFGFSILVIVAVTVGYLILSFSLKAFMAVYDKARDDFQEFKEWVSAKHKK